MSRDNSAREWSTPNIIVVCIRFVVRFPSTAVKSVFHYVKLFWDGDRESRVVEERTVENALEEFERKLRNTFGKSKIINEVMQEAEGWFQKAYIVCDQTDVTSS